MLDDVLNISLLLHCRQWISPNLTKLRKFGKLMQKNVRTRRVSYQSKYVESKLSCKIGLSSKKREFIELKMNPICQTLCLFLHLKSKTKNYIFFFVFVLFNVLRKISLWKIKYVSTNNSYFTWILLKCKTLQFS
jgi:hypothetical protein